MSIHSTLESAKAALNNGHTEFVIAATLLALAEAQYTENLLRAYSDLRGKRPATAAEAALLTRIYAALEVEHPSAKATPTGGGS